MREHIKQKFCLEFTLNNVQSRKRHNTEPLATLEEAKAAAVEVPIRTFMFGNEASANP